MNLNNFDKGEYIKLATTLIFLEISSLKIYLVISIPKIKKKMYPSEYFMWYLLVILIIKIAKNKKKIKVLITNNLFWNENMILNVM